MVQQAPQSSKQRRRAILFTEFPPDFISTKIVPELRKRGVDVVWIDKPVSCDQINFKTIGADLVLHMHEMGSHPNSAKITRVCKNAGIPVRALSRKKASWPFEIMDEQEASGEREKDDEQEASSESPTAASVSSVENPLSTALATEIAASNAAVTVTNLRAEVKRLHERLEASTQLQLTIQDERDRARKEATEAKKEREEQVFLRVQLEEELGRMRIEHDNLVQQNASAVKLRRVADALKLLVADGLLSEQEAAEKLTKMILT